MSQSIFTDNNLKGAAIMSYGESRRVFNRKWLSLVIFFLLILGVVTGSLCYIWFAKLVEVPTNGFVDVTLQATTKLQANSPVVWYNTQEQNKPLKSRVGYFMDENGKTHAYGVRFTSLVNVFSGNLFEVAIDGSEDDLKTHKVSLFSLFGWPWDATGSEEVEINLDLAAIWGDVKPFGLPDNISGELKNSIWRTDYVLDTDGLQKIEVMQDSNAMILPGNSLVLDNFLNANGLVRLTREQSLLSWSWDNEGLVVDQAGVIGSSGASSMVMPDGEVLEILMMDDKTQNSTSSARVTVKEDVDCPGNVIGFLDANSLTNVFSWIGLQDRVFEKLVLANEDNKLILCFP